MLFNSLNFIIFFLIVYGLYYISSHRWQNRLLIFASCIFYATWSWKFLLVMFISITTDFFCARYIDRLGDVFRRRILLLLSVSVNLAILGFFKYFNFFVSNFQSLLEFLHLANPAVNWSLKIILPVGISFYTFEAISYIVDVYRRQTKSAENYWDYVLFVIYFPHLVAGPIMRVKSLLPQIINPRIMSMEQVSQGCFLILWGLYLKVFVADNLAVLIVDPIFASPPPYDLGLMIIGTYAFSFQILGDFAGYSSIARGLGKCMGFDIMENFRNPYFSTNPTDFWKRWHISLSTWLRDYLYIPLGGNRKGQYRTYLNLFLTMLLGGLWHGASWTFVLWGCYHGFLLIFYKRFQPFLNRFSFPEQSSLNKAWIFLRTIFFFQLICLGWLIFRSQSLTQLGLILHSRLYYNDPIIYIFFIKLLMFYVLLFIFLEWVQFRDQDALTVIKWPLIPRVATYMILLYSLIIFGVSNAQYFIYFQF